MAGVLFHKPINSKNLSLFFFYYQSCSAWLIHKTKSTNKVSLAFIIALSY
jgi:uncharacterized protein with PQ loop repeat